MADQPRPVRSRSKTRRVLCILAAGVVALIVIVILLPTFISWGLGQGLIRSAIERNVNGSVRTQRISVGWVSDQAIEGLQIIDSRGVPATDVNLRVDAGLLRLMFARQRPVNIAVTGSVSGQRRVDGTINFQELFAKPASADELARRPGDEPRADQPFQMPNLPPVNLNLSQVRLQFENLQTQQTLSINDLSGTVAYGGFDQPSSADLRGTEIGLPTASTATPGSESQATNSPGSESRATSGDFALRAQVANMFDGNGRVRLNGATARLDINAQNLPLPLLDRPAHLDSMTANFSSDDLTGRMVTSIDLVARLSESGQLSPQDAAAPSSLSLTAALANVFGADGAFSLEGANAHININTSNVPVQAGEINATVQQMSIAIVSDNLTQSVQLAVDGSTQINGAGEAAASPIRADLHLDRLLAANGQLQTQGLLQRVRGEVHGERVPSPVMQPFMPDAVMLVRDVGATVNVNGAFAAQPQQSVSLTIEGERGRLEITGERNPADGSIAGTHLLLQTSNAHPDLVRDLTKGAITTDRPTDVAITLTSFGLPADLSQISEYAATGSMRINGPAGLILQAQDQDGAAAAPPEPAPQPIVVQNLNLQLETPRLGDGLQVRGSFETDQATVRIDQRITNLFDAQGQLAPMNATPVGTLAAENVSAQTLARFAPDQAATLQEVVGRGMTVRANTSAAEGPQGIRAEIEVNSSALAANLNAVRLANVLRVESGHMELTVTPRLLQELQKNSQDPAVLRAPAKAVIELEPVELVRTGEGALDYSLPAETPLLASLRIDDAIIEKAPGLTGREPLNIRNFASQLSMARSGPQQPMVIAANGDTALWRAPVAANQAQADQMIGAARFRVNLTTSEPFEISGVVGLADLSVPQLEQWLGYERDALAQWTGDEGFVRADFTLKGDVMQATLTTDMPNIEGQFTANSDGETLTLQGESPRFLLSRAALEQRMNPAAEGAPPAAEHTVRVERDVPMGLTIKQARLPMALIRGEPFDPAAVLLDGTLMGGPMHVMGPSVSSTLRDLNVTWRAQDLSRGLEFTITGRADTVIVQAPPPQDQPAPAQTPPPGTIGRLPDQPAPPQPAAQPPAGEPMEEGVINITGRFTDLVSADSTLNLDQAKLTMTAQADGVPTAVLDGLLNMRGMLVAAVGEQMRATINVQNFSRNTGQLDARINTTNGWLEGLLRGRENTLRATQDETVRAELVVTPELRERLLYRIHPLLADMRTTQQPIRATVSRIIVPLDADASKLRGDVEITVGRVEFDAGSVMLQVLSLFHQPRETIPGEIEPIVAKIRNGVVRYDRFAVHIDKYTLNYSGQIDLVKQTMDLRTEIPLEALAHSFQELQGYADKIVVPLVTRGDFGAARTMIDPKFDVGKAALEAGFRGTLEDLLRGRGGSGNLLDDLLRPPPPRPRRR